MYGCLLRVKTGNMSQALKNIPAEISHRKLNSHSLWLTWDPHPNTPTPSSTTTLPHTPHLSRPIYQFPLDVPPHTIEVTRFFPLAGQWRYEAGHTMGYSLR